MPEENSPEQENPKVKNPDGENTPAEAPLSIRLDQFLQLCGVPTGGQAKMLIQGGEVLVNGEVETRRRKKLVVGDEVGLDGEVYDVAFEPEAED